MPICHWPVERLTEGVGADEKMSLSRCFGILRAHKGKVGAQSLTHLSYIRFQSSRESLAFSDEFRGIIKQFVQDVQNPRALLAWSGGTLLPLVVCVSQSFGLSSIPSIQTLRKYPKKHWQGNEGSGDLNKGEPVGVMT
jgi:hypothetical protein